MIRLYQNRDPEDFQAKIRFFTVEEGGRRQYANGTHFDFQYSNDSMNIYMIHPDFFDYDGNSFSIDTFLPLNEWLNARMYVIVTEMREQMHRDRIRVGIKFYCIDGKHIAEGVVTNIVGINTKNK